MKQIRQIFKNNPSLMDEPEVQELIEYCQDLEGELFDKNNEVKYDKELILLEMIRDIYKSCKDKLEYDQLTERYPDLYPKIENDDIINNLKKFIQDMFIENNISF